MRRRAAALALALLATEPAGAVDPPAPGSLRVATFNTALNRKGAGLLLADLARGRSRQIAGVVAIIVAVRPDILALNEVDHDPEGRALAALAEAIRAAGGPDYPHRFTGPVNTGLQSGLDLDANGTIGGPEDAWGYGRFPGQYGMGILSRFPLGAARSWQTFRWVDLPGATLPRRDDGTPFPSAEVQAALRLSSKSHWVVPVDWPGGTVDLLLSHPTPPVFDDEHDLNGRRNRDEILFWARYLDGLALKDDAGVDAPRPDRPVIVMGDLNADPVDGDGLHDGIRELLAHPALQDPRPASPGAVAAAGEGANRRHRGDPAQDTADFNDTKGPGNLRADYVLPARAFTVTGSGVFWPGPGEPLADLVATPRAASDHRLVWVDLALPAAPAPTP